MLSPLEERAAELARGGPQAPGYDAAYRRIVTVYTAMAVGVLVAIFFMVTKLGA